MPRIRDSNQLMLKVLRFSKVVGYLDILYHNWLSFHYLGFWPPPSQPNFLELQFFLKPSSTHFCHSSSPTAKVLGFSSLFSSCRVISPFRPFILPHTHTHTHIVMQRALTSRARASVLSNAASTKYRAGAGLSQQVRFAHKVNILFLSYCECANLCHVF